MAPLAVAALLAGTSARLLEVRNEIVAGRPAVAASFSGEPDGLTVRREGDELRLTMEAEAEPALRAPEARPPVRSVRVEVAPPRVTVRIGIPADVRYEVQRGGGRFTLVFLTASGEARPSTAELYRRIFPTVPEPSTALPALAEGAGPREGREDDGEGLRLGLLRIRPSLSLSYVDAETALLDTPEPVRDQYVQLEPRVGGEVILWDGRVRGGYEPKLRGASSFPQVERTSHRAYASVDLPVGARFRLEAGDQWTSGVLETTEVDPGREYFFDLGPFTRNHVSGAVSFEVGPRLDLRASGSHNLVDVEEGFGFYDYQAWTAGGGLAYEVGPSLEARLMYRHERVPPPADRPLAASRSGTLDLQLAGELGALTRADLTLGYRDQSSPGAGPGGRAYRGLTLEGWVHRELGQAASLSLQGGRSTPLSAFEQNAFYVSSFVQAGLVVPGPLQLSVSGTAGYHWNDYRTIASELGVPREDRIFGWSLGVGRGLTRWGYARVDYRRERRTSNLDALENRTRALLVQIGIGLFGAPAWP